MTRCTTLASLMLLLPLPALAAAPQGVTIGHAWFATAPHTPAIGFFSIRNAGSQPQLVTGWQSPGCRSMRLEEASGAGRSGVNGGLTLPGKSRMVFVHGSYHLSCDGPTQALRVGTTVPVTFSFRGGATLTVPFEVREVGAHRAVAPQAATTTIGGG